MLWLLLTWTFNGTQASCSINPSTWKWRQQCACGLNEVNTAKRNWMWWSLQEVMRYWGRALNGMLSAASHGWFILHAQLHKGSFPEKSQSFCLPVWKCPKSSYKNISKLLIERKQLQPVDEPQLCTFHLCYHIKQLLVQYWLSDWAPWFQC